MVGQSSCLNTLHDFCTIVHSSCLHSLHDFLHKFCTNFVRLKETCEQKKKHEKGRSLEPRNDCFYAFRDNFLSGDPLDKGCNLEPINPSVHAFRANF